MGSVWTRFPRAKPPRLSLEAIVAAAIGLADAHGLDAVSIRRVAAELSARPMSLYSFMDRKDDLIEMIVDEVMSEMIVDELPAGWREALHAIAAQTRAAGHRHPWLMTAISQRPPMGPNAVRHSEQSMAAISRLGLDPGRARALLIAVDAFTIGFGSLELAERAMRQRDGLTDSQWEASTGAHLARLSRTGQVPHLAQFSDDIAGDAFRAGLDWLLAGFAAEADAQPDTP
ncbi:TetR/AcrR family transcriptional regulator C-terminal domain-containing protein [Micromonospora sp. DT201]|uniref:TetR/AcrR family transcriptional regulator C-terminal domain-containing protein n=1 Tax=Micromonospora sp. DT201 TaxID=3393442 RepID=UPI003CEBDD95